MLADHINAEIVSGTITSKQEAMDYITWTYFFRRLLMNPSYYGLENVDHDVVNKYLSTVVQTCVGELERSSCLEVDEVMFLQLNLVVFVRIANKSRSYYSPSRKTGDSHFAIKLTSLKWQATVIPCYCCVLGKSIGYSDNSGTYLILLLPQSPLTSLVSTKTSRELHVAGTSENTECEYCFVNN